MAPTLKDVIAKLNLVKSCLERLNDPKLGLAGLMLAVIEEELIDMDLYGEYKRNG